MEVIMSLKINVSHFQKLRKKSALLLLKDFRQSLHYPG